MINDSFSQFLMFFNNGFWFYSMMGGWSTWQWVFSNSSQNFWSFDTPDTPGCASAVFADNQSENEIWNRLKQFLPVCHDYCWRFCSMFIHLLNVIKQDWKLFQPYKLRNTWQILKYTCLLFFLNILHQQKSDVQSFIQKKRRKEGNSQKRGNKDKAFFMAAPQFYIQLVNRPHFGTWILLFGPFGQSGQ